MMKTTRKSLLIPAMLLSTGIALHGGESNRNYPVNRPPLAQRFGRGGSFDGPLALIPPRKGRIHPCVQ